MSDWREWLQGINFSQHPEIMQDEVKQWFHPEEDVLAKTNQRPTSLTPNEYDWRSLQGRYPALLELPENIVGKSVDEFQYPYTIEQSDRNISPNRVSVPFDRQKPFWYKPGTDAGTYMGLGRNTQSIGLGPSKDPYLSIYDLWDFAGDPLRSYFTQGGTPYNVYDKFPIPLENSKYPQYISTNPRKTKDIYLPPEPVRGIGPRKLP